MRRRAAAWIAVGAIAATGCERGTARRLEEPAPLPVPAHVAGLFDGPRTLTFDVTHAETVFEDEGEAIEATAGRLRCAQEVAVVGEFHAARITCDDEATPLPSDGDGEAPDAGDAGSDGDAAVAVDDDVDAAVAVDGELEGAIDDDEAAGLSMPIDMEIEGVYVTDGVGLWRDDSTEPWPPPLGELRALVLTPALIAGVPVPGRDDHPTEAEEARGDYHEVTRSRHDGHDGLCGGDVSIGAGSAVQTWCVDGPHGLYVVHRAVDNAAMREDRAELVDE